MFKATRAYLHGATVVLNKSDIANSKDEEFSEVHLYLEMCEWSEDDEGSWSCSKCTAVWIFPEDGPGENSMSYCPECGRKIVKITPYQEESDEDE